MLGALAIVFGAVAALVYARAGLTLSHYDAKAHLVVARRVLDSLTPEWSQVGAVWLPLPHLLNLFPVQVDALYRTGLSAVAISVMSFGVMCYAAARLSFQVTGSSLGALAAVALLALDPNVLYLQSTPMTEPLLFGLTLLGISLLYDWIATGALRPPRAAGLTLAAACLTRYEAWFVTLAAIGLAALALWRQGLTVRRACGAVSRVALYPAVAIAAFVVHSWYSTGEWFVAGGFFVADNAAQGHVYDALVQVAWGMTRISGSWFAMIALAAACALAFQRLLTPTPSAFLDRGAPTPTKLLARGDPIAPLRSSRGGEGGRPASAKGYGASAEALREGRRPGEGVQRGTRAETSALVTLSLTAFMALPWYAFFDGHPFRMRYLMAPAVAVAVFCGIAVGMLRLRWRIAAAAAVGIVLAFTARPFDRTAPILIEAQWDRANSLARRPVTECLMRGYHGEPILVSMGSLAHYMQEMSHEGLNIRDFVHEGNRPFWQNALKDPKGRVGWILIEEKAEGGDLLFLRAKESPSFLSGFHRICDGGGVALYQAHS